MCHCPCGLNGSEKKAKLTYYCNKDDVMEIPRIAHAEFLFAGVKERFLVNSVFVLENLAARVVYAAGQVEFNPKKL